MWGESSHRRDECAPPKVTDKLGPSYDAIIPMRILAFAYACEPERGSEPGAGWAWARMLARLGETWVITRRDYEASIEQALQWVPERANLKFAYVELPENVRSWQRGLRGLRVYYLLWQIAALKEARRLRRSVRFDVVWHLTWANAWYGTLAALAERPFVYGPVGGCVGTVWGIFYPSWDGAELRMRSPGARSWRGSVREPAGTAVLAARGLDLGSERGNP